MGSTLTDPWKIHLSKCQFSCKESKCQLQYGCCWPSPPNAQACSQVTCGQRRPVTLKRKRPRLLPSLHTDCAGWAEPLTDRLWSGEEDTHTPLFLFGEPSQTQVENRDLIHPCFPDELIIHFWFVLVPSVHYSNKP